MISIKKGVFKLDTAHTSYLFDTTLSGKLRHLYYGKRLPAADAEALAVKNEIQMGSAVQISPGECLDDILLEYSGIGRGDYRHSPLECVMPDGTFVTDFSYEAFTVSQEVPTLPELPSAHGNGETLTVILRDTKFKAYLKLHYAVFEACDVIVRWAELENCTEGDIRIRKIMSAMVDLPDAGYVLGTLDGGWAKETHIHERHLGWGIHVTDSTTGGSSNRHNPAFYLKRPNADELQGEVLGFNLVYSGNHYSAVERGVYDTTRVMQGISPHCFEWTLQPGKTFTAPQCVMTWSNAGVGGMAANFHDFVNAHIIPRCWQGKERPIVLNNWEATMFDFTKGKILTMAKRAAELGVELFVLDDGWFGSRSSDTAGLGDWTVNEKKLPGGITDLAKKINALGLQFGLWFEPECVNPDSSLYRAHPDWAITVPGRKPCLGRNQLVLDLTKPEVRDYIVNAVDAVLCTANIAYVKWDYNRHISDMCAGGEFFHRYMLGLYEILNRLFREKHPHILLEGCSSGGNRFDLGWLSYAPQIWTSDDTDAAERLEIQRGVYCFYPPSAVSNHVSMTPNQQTLRTVALSTRFNVAAFGVLGYELDLGELTPEERKQIKEQIVFYKANRKLFQYGRLRRYFPRSDRESWQMTEGTTTAAAIYNLSYQASPARDTLKILSAESGKRYRIKSVPQSLKISRFGGLIKHVTPVKLKPDGLILRTVSNHYAMTDGQEEYSVSGETLSAGINLAMQYSGTGYDPHLRILGDWGSSLYMVTEEK